MIKIISNCITVMRNNFDLVLNLFTHVPLRSFKILVKMCTFIWEFGKKGPLPQGENTYYKKFFKCFMHSMSPGYVDDIILCYISEISV